MVRPGPLEVIPEGLPPMNCPLLNATLDCSTFLAVESTRRLSAGVPADFVRWLEYSLRAYLKSVDGFN